MRQEAGRGPTLLLMSQTLMTILVGLAMLGIAVAFLLLIALITGLVRRRLGLRGPGLASAGSIDYSGGSDSMTAVSDGWKPDHEHLTDSDSVWSWGFSGDAVGGDTLGADSISGDSGGND